MRLYVTGVLAIVLLAGVSARGEDTPEGELKKFQGGWELVSYTVDGKAWPKEDVATIKLLVKGDVSYFTVGAETLMGSYVLDPSMKPKALDILLTDGPDKGKKKLSIYKINGDSLIICHGPTAGKTRPKEFVSKPGSETTLEVWRRAKAK